MRFRVQMRLSTLMTWMVVQLFASQVSAQVPIDPIEGILNAFRTHRIVGMGDGIAHGDEVTQRFRIKLIRDPRFQTTVDDILLENGNSLYQDLADRFVQGEEIDYTELKKIWQNTTQVVPMADAPLTEEFLRAVRDVNAFLPKSEWLRVLLWDPPLDWDQNPTREQVTGMQTGRDAHAVEVLRREVLARNRRALVITGAMHLQRKNLFYNYENDVEWLLAGLERSAEIKVFNIWVAADVDRLYAEAARWPVPSLILIKGTPLGAADFTAYYPYEVQRASMEHGKRIPVAREEWRSLRMEEQFDAVLSVGPRSSITFSDVSAENCADPEYMKMRLGRLELMGMSGVGDTLKTRCRATLARQQQAR